MAASNSIYLIERILFSNSPDNNSSSSSIPKKQPRIHIPKPSSPPIPVQNVEDRKLTRKRLETLGRQMDLEAITGTPHSEAVVKELEHKDRKFNSAFFDTLGKPVVGVLHAITPDPRLEGRTEEIASLNLVNRCYISIQVYKGNVLLRSNFELTEDGYTLFSGYVRSNLDHTTAKNGYSLKLDAHKFYVHRKRLRASIEIKSTGLTPSQIGSQKNRGMGQMRDTLKIKDTTQSINALVYDKLLDTYQQHSFLMLDS